MGVTSSLISLLPPRDRNSCVLCTGDCKTFATLEEFNINSTVSELNSVGKLIQTCLEVKVSDKFQSHSGKTSSEFPTLCHKVLTQTGLFSPRG